MPRIYDNIKAQLLDGLHESLKSSVRADFCIGYFNLRGWKHIAAEVDKLAGAFCKEKDEHEDINEVVRFCRVLIGMQPSAAEMLRQYLNEHEQQTIRQNDVVRLKRKIAEDFRSQLTKGIPTDQDERTLRKLSKHLRSGKVVVKLHLRNRLHAKLYVLHRNDSRLPIEAYLGSSNLTYSGLKGQGELNVDVQEHPAPQTLANWFEDRWNDRFSIDITLELADIIDESWIKPRHPYHIYLKMAYHLSGEARMGLLEYDIPRDFEAQLLEFQRQAVKIAAKKLEKRGGVLIGDVVGLGKTVTACALAKMKEVRDGMGCIIICPAALVQMWDGYVRQYDLKADVISLGSVQTQLKQYHDVRQRLLILDESHNLRNASGSRYGAIRTLIEENASQVVLLTATPYNKTFLDLSNQLRLFIPDDKDLGVAPEAYIRTIGGAEAFALELGDIPPQSLRAFEYSEEPDDWRELMRMYMVRRTRTFIREHYSKTDPANGREYLLFPNGDRFYFPTRVAKRAEFPFDPSNANDPYARLYSARVVDAINDLNLPRYGLALYLDEPRKQTAHASDRLIMENLSRAGKRLMGFCRTNLFKRLESSGWAFLLSIARHILRNEVFLYAIDQDKLVPIGKSYTPLTDDFLEDQDPDEDGTIPLMTKEEEFKNCASKAYAAYEAEAEKFHWLDPRCFTPTLQHDLREDNNRLRNILAETASWSPLQDRKLHSLRTLLATQHGEEKVLVFSQYADTATYLERSLQKDIADLAVATGGSDNLVSLAHRFSPVSNKTRTDRPLRVLIATDVLSEGQNLQDARIIVNYDLPWAIIRLIQRAGRVDRIGQKAEEILCYSFLPEDGIENIIALRGRLRRRMEQNAEVVGSDEVFFEDDRTNLTALYTEQSGILDGEEENEGEVDMTSYALGIWKEATDNAPALAKLVQDLPDVVHATQPADEARPAESVIVYCRTAAENDVLAWMEPMGQPVTTSQMNILKAAACTPDTPALPRTESHYSIEHLAVEHIHAEERRSGGTLGSKRSVRYRVYDRMKTYCERNRHTLFVPEKLELAVDAVFQRPLKAAARESLGKHLRGDGITDEALASMLISLWEEALLVHEEDDEEAQPKQTQIICSMGFA